MGLEIPFLLRIPMALRITLGTRFIQCNEEKILPHKRLGFDFQE
jgi:hypothetical protein